MVNTLPTETARDIQKLYILYCINHNLF